MRRRIPIIVILGCASLVTILSFCLHCRSLAPLSLIFLSHLAVIGSMAVVYGRYCEQQRELLNHRNLLQTILDGIPDAINVQMPDHTIVYLNSSGREPLGPNAEVIGRKCYAVFGRSVECDGCLAQQALRTKTIAMNECSYPSKDAIFDRRCIPVLDRDGQVSYIIELIRDITAAKQNEQRIRYLTFHDRVTGLYNRAFAEEEMKRLDTARQLPLSLIMGDVNGLKLTNDVFGHHEGDRLLAHIGTLLHQSCRQEDIVARWGGDEFLILLPQTDHQSAELICQRIKANCRQRGDAPILPSIALGYATKARGDEALGHVLRRAEDCMYDAKLQESDITRQSILESLLDRLDGERAEMKAHGERVQRLARMLAEAVNIAPGEQRRALAPASLFHDIGKVRGSDMMRTQPDVGSEDEPAIGERHPEAGYRIAQALGYHHAAELILAHHERWDGTGYPRQLKGEQIPLSSRIIAIANAYDHMVQGSAQRKAMSHEEALTELCRQAGGQFDPELVRVFIELG